MSDGHSGVGMAGSATAAVHPAGDSGSEPRQEDQNDSRTFTPGQKVELAVQVGSWKEGTPCLIIGEEDGSLPYEWRVTVLRDCGALDASMYEHELRPRQPSLIERLVARTDDEWLVGYKGWVKPAGENHFWGGSVSPASELLRTAYSNHPALRDADGEAGSFADGLGTDEPWSVPRDPFGAAVDALYAESENLLLSKNRDYGNRNISQSPGGPLMGLAVRLHDKLARLTNLLATGADPEHESLRDTMLDIMGYGAIGVLVTDGAWPE